MPTPDQDGKQTIILRPREMTKISAPFKNVINARVVIPITSPLNDQRSPKEESHCRSLGFGIKAVLSALESVPFGKHFPM